MSRAVFRFVLIVAAFSAWAAAQVQRGAIVGTVIDPKGSAVAKAKVTATTAGTKAKVTTSTASDGSYAIRNLPAAGYDVAIEAKGFKKSLTQNVQVGAGDGIRVDIQLAYTDISLAVQQGKLIREALERTYQDGGRERHEENGIHACRPGHAMVDVDLSSDTLFCYHISNDTSSEESRVEESTRREGLLACPAGWYMRGLRDTQQHKGWFKDTITHEFVLLCSRRPDVTPSGEWKADGGCGAGKWQETEDLLQHPDLYGPSAYWPPTILTGIWLCATTQPIPQGKVVFYHHCAGCHGTDGNAAIRDTRMFHKITSRPLGSPEVQAMTNDDLQKVFTARHGGLTSGIKLSKVEIQDLLSYIRTLK